MSLAKVELSRVIGELRNQLRAARDDGQGKLPRFVVKDAQIELQVGITAEGEAKGGVSFWVYTVEAGGKLSREVTQTIRLNLSVTDGTKDGDFEISDEIDANELD